MSFDNNEIEFYKDQSVSLEMNITNAVNCDIDGNIQLFSNGMSIHTGHFQPVINGDTISYGPEWERLVPQGGEPVGFRIGTGAVFVPRPGYEDRYYLLYTNYDGGVDTTELLNKRYACLLYTSPSPRDATLSRMPSSA